MGRQVNSSGARNSEVAGVVMGSHDRGRSNPMCLGHPF